MSFFKKIHKHDVEEKIDRIEAGIKNLFHPNSRHDEPHEQAYDQALEAICKSHRFQSFAKPREGNHVKWYVDGHDYFYAVSELLESATETIFIQDWWLTPELYLRRPPALNERWRLDRILKRKAEAGVKICVIVYKEVELNMTMNSLHTKHALEALHPSNVACMRHPDHLDGEESTLFWSHHQKVIVVDNTFACIGGLDLCMGRWDTPSHSLADCHLSDFTQTVWPGQDYNNARVADFQKVDEWVSNQESRLELPRMPWHDTHMMLEGSAVSDVCQHFVERWNFIYNLKYRKKAHTDGRYELLGFPIDVGSGYPDQVDHPEHEPVTRHPHYEHWTRIGRRFMGRRDDAPVSYAPRPSVDRSQRLSGIGNMRVQVCRSSSDWSNGTITEHSIMNAYIKLIEESEKFIYIENQFFITTCGSEGHVKNQIGRALAERIIRAARSGTRFKIMVVIPCIPGFAGDLDNPSASAGTLAIMQWTYKSICRGQDSIYYYVKQAGFDANDYISFYNLRNFDRINNEPVTLRDIESRTGISYYMTQAALARIYLGENASKEELEKNKVVRFKLAQEGEGVETSKLNFKARDGKTIEVKLPDSLEEARAQLMSWSAAAPGYDREIADSIVTQDVPGGLKNLAWLGDEESERAAFVSEELYIHTKLMIVDDKKVIMGSANCNDRSMLGDRDSEIALIVEDNETLDSKMDGEYWPAGRFAATLRRQLFKEHLGLLKPRSSLLQRDEPTRSMLPVTVPQEDATYTEADRTVADPMGYELENMWKGTAQRNTEAFNNVFRPVPAAGIRTWKQYKAYVPSGRGAPKVCHVVNEAGSLEDVKNQLDQIKGHLVEMPLDFLADDDMYQEGAAVNPVTMSIYT
ncbi:hypothetical protein CROQUDRAFT_713026 [Cronartium quercuum f. sp. fusiforme G11]|uniref:Phospholipase n=1 Tax=Cronartium quercuum f. sp. fusiforme G11 TaxID=708437 RepID=A0A9P6TG33_9BASI|nr:hypothetical protein CROQUDRAFT_713026 [Cronartium quercuum f. sp. fusiforme G11]